MLVLDPSGSATILKGEDIASTMGLGDWIAIVEVIALAGSWRWILGQNISYSGWRRKASLAALACVSLAVLLDATNKGLLHLILSEQVSGNHATELLAAMRPIIWTAATIACLSLILGLVGKGSPKLLALAWLCVLFFPNASILPSLTSELYGAWRGRAPIRSRLAALAGRGGVYCGTVGPRTDPKSSSDCVLKSFEDHKPFYVVYDTQEFEIDSHFIDGLAGDKSGNLYDVEFSSMGWSSEGLSAETQLLDFGHIFVEPCAKPIALSKSIYKGLTCIPRIMERPSETKPPR